MPKKFLDGFWHPAKLVVMLPQGKQHPSFFIRGCFEFVDHCADVEQSVINLEEKW
jgi:hypothetical protein